MPQAAPYADQPLSAEQVKAAGYTDAPLASEHPWVQQYPKIATALRAGLDALPGIGGIVGGVIATPESAGAATIPGVALGVGAGRGLRDLIAEGLGLDKKSSAVGKGGRIALDVGEAAAAQALMPGVIEAIKTPGRTVRQVLELLPAKLRPSIPEGIAKAPAAILKRPAWQTWAEYGPKETPQSPPGATGTRWAPGAPVVAQEARATAAAPMAQSPESVAGGTPPPAGPQSSPAPAGSPAKSPQMLLNEEALARRQAAYQAKLKAEAAQAPAAAPIATEEEGRLYWKLRDQGKTDAEARSAIAAAREINTKFGLKTPTTAQTKFPKGNRGGLPKDEQ